MSDVARRGSSTPVRRLMHRWFVEYNPLYLVSAALVLVGMTVLSRAASQPTGEPEIGFVPWIAEVYGFALIGGAALLYRIGQRRPAVMLALLTILYQGDLTLLTERQVHLGPKGAVAACAWWLLFMVKTKALARALRLRLSRSFVGLAAAGAGGLALLPQLTAHAGSPVARLAVSLWLFGIVLAMSWTRREIVSEVALDGWQAAVLGRAVAVTWTVWGIALGLHVWFWSSESTSGSLLDPRLMGVGAFLVLTRWVRSERLIWATTACALVVTALAWPESLWFVASMAAAVLALHARSISSSLQGATATPSRAEMYRQGWKPEEPEAAEPEAWRIEAADPGAGARFLGGVALTGWLAIWVYGWNGGALPRHQALLDVSLAIATVGIVWRARRPTSLAAPSLAYAHLAFQLRWWAWLSAAAWATSSVALGFAVLAGSLAVAWKLRDTEREVSDDATR